MSRVQQLKLFLEKDVTVYYGINIIDKLVDYVNQYNYDKIFVLSNEYIFRIHGQELKSNLEKANINFEILHFHCEEKDKNFKNLEHICDTLIKKKISKDSIILSFGGGTAGNIFGLAASLIYRGVRYIEIPTTFMGQTDSTLSNKQAINGESGKNQIGTYYAPIFVWTDIIYILTEELRYIRAALVEGIKNTLIYDKETLPILKKYINYVEYNKNELLDLFEIIITSKNKILKCDPTEKRQAVILEYGHTFGHAIEFLTMGKIIHGEAVAIGMCIAAEVSNLLSCLNNNDKISHYSILMPFITSSVFELFCNLDNNAIYDKIQNDNKRGYDGVKYVLLQNIGECVGSDDYQCSVSKDIIYNALDNFREYVKLANKMKEAGSL